MAVYRPSMMCLVTLKLDESAVVSPPGLGLPQILTSMHPKLLRAMWPQGSLATAHRLQPLKVRLHKNSHMTADTCSAEFLWRNLPIDPRSIVGGVLQVFGGTVSDRNYAAGIPDLKGDRLVEPRSILVSSVDKSMFTGMFDSSEIDWGSGGSFTILEARDLTQLLIDYKIPTWVMNDLPDFEVPLHVWIGNLIGTNDVLASVIRSVDVVGWPTLVLEGPPELIPFASASVSADDIRTKVSRGTTGKRKRRRNPKLMTGTKYWDLIVDMCIGAGVIPNVQDDRIVLRPARTFYGKESHRDSRFVRTFGGIPQSVRRLVYGGNLKRYNLRRNHGGSTVPIVRVVSHDRTGRVVSAAWPPGLLQKVPVVPTHPFGRSVERKILVVPFHGSTDPDVLLVVARTLWELMARQEFSGSIKTAHLASDMGDLSGVVDPNDDPDLLWLDVGDPLEILTATSSSLHGQSNDVADIYSKSAPEIAAYLRKQYPGVIDPNLEPMLLTIAEAIRSPRLQRYFRCSGISIDFDSKTGIEIDVKFHNYYEVVWDAASRSVFTVGPGPVATELPALPIP